MMTNSKRHYWLKLKEDFFEDDTIAWLEEQDNGADYALFYLKLCLKSIKTGGHLIRTIGNMVIPYNIKKLAEITNTDFDTAVVAMELFKKSELAEVLEGGEFYLTKLDKMVDSESESTERVRRYRNRFQETHIEPLPLHCNADVTQPPLHCNVDVTQPPLHCNADVTQTPLHCNAEYKDKSIDNIRDYNIYKYNNKNINNIYNNSLNNSLSCSNFNQSSHTENHSDLLFNRFWQAYPRKVGKRNAQKAFERLQVDKPLLDKMLRQIAHAKQSRQWQDVQYIPHPATWLNGRRWEDELPTEDEFSVKNTFPAKEVSQYADTGTADPAAAASPWRRGLIG